MGLENREIDDDQDEAKLGKADYSKLRQSDESMWGKLDYAGEQKRDKIADALQKFQEATGMDESRHIREVKKARNGKELHEKEEKMKAASKKWYRMKLADSGLFEPMDDAETEFINFEHKSLLARFDKLNLAEGDVNMASVLSNIDQDLEPRRRFRNKLTNLKQQNPFVFNEYIALLPTLGLVGSKEALLGKVLVAMKPVMNQPQALQRAFKEKRKSLGSKKETAPLVAEVTAEYKKRIEGYNKVLYANSKYFGGREVDGQPEALVEFKNWFAKLDSFAEMDAAMKELPKLIAKRKKLHDQSEAIISKAKPEMQEKLRANIKEMRRHQLESFMDSLESAVTNDNMHIGDAGTALLKEVDGVPLFSKFEIENETRKMQKISLNGQSGQVESLKIEIEEREKVVKEYQELPDKMRDDETFLEANHQDRIKMLQDAKNAQLTGHDNPFDIAADDDVDYLDELENELDSGEGEKMLDGFIDDVEEDDDTESAELINLTRKRIGLKDNTMKKHNEDQKDAYIRDAKYWVRLDENAEKEEDVHTAREKTKVKFIKEAENAWDEGFVTNAAGLLRERQDINVKELRKGDKKAKERVQRARYGFEINVQKEDGQDQEREVGKMLDNLSEEQMKILVEKVTNMLLGNLKIAAGKVSSVKNSGKIKDKIRDRMIRREYFGNLKKAS